MQRILTEKRIVLAVTGSIAAYKSAILASQLTKAGAQVDIIMTEAAQRFVTPLTFKGLTGRPVYTDMWQTDSSGGLGTHIAHVGLAHEADLFVIAPCTANTLAKLALGLSQDLLGVTALAARCPIIVAPAMDAGMYENAATQAHVHTLKDRGVIFAGPTMGRMASGYEGLGRFLEPEHILEHCQYVLSQGGLLAERKIIVTAGPTREALDPVRYISNHSSGKQGFAIAQAALEAGADVTLISGPTNLTAPVGIEVVPIDTAIELRDAVMAHAALADALVMSAAVADFRPATQSEQKIKKTSGPPTIELVANPDILKEVAASTKRPNLVVGFAAESQSLLENAQRKLEQKNLDLIVANDITAADAGFQADTNRVFLISKSSVEELPLLTKREVAQRIVGWIYNKLTEQHA